jgi:hypothetical protein
LSRLPNLRAAGSRERVPRQNAAAATITVDADDDTSAIEFGSKQRHPSGVALGADETQRAPRREPDRCTARARDRLSKLMNRPLADLRLAVMMLDGIDLHGRTNIVALGITTGGKAAVSLDRES